MKLHVKGDSLSILLLHDRIVCLKVLCVITSHCQYLKYFQSDFLTCCELLIIRTKPGPCTAVGGGQGGNWPPEKTIFIIFKVSLLTILWIFGTFSAYWLYCPLMKKSFVRPCTKLIIEIFRDLFRNCTIYKTRKMYIKFYK
jgi:hypothetical protein